MNFDKMDSKARKDWELLIKNTVYLNRFVYDVLVYTLTKCGLPKRRLPITDLQENAYIRTDFLQIAGASTLQIALLTRDTLKRMFTSRLNSSGFTKEDIPVFLANSVECLPFRLGGTSLCQMQLILSSCNEIIMFFYRENIYIDFGMVINSINVYFVRALGLNRYFPATIEETFRDFDNISGYTRWITDFIAKFGIPYGFMSDFSDLFLEHLEKYRDTKITSCPNMPSAVELQNRLGFLPHDLLSAFTMKESVPSAENITPPSGWILPGDRKSPEIPKLPESSENVALEERKSNRRRKVPQANVSELAVQGRPDSKDSFELGIEDDSGQTSLRAEAASQISNCAKVPKKKKKAGKKKSSE